MLNIKTKKVITSLARGYIRKSIGETQPEPYQGKYGKGYKTYSHNPKSTRYCFVNYYII